MKKRCFCFSRRAVRAAHSTLVKFRTSTPLQCQKINWSRLFLFAARGEKSGKVRRGGAHVRGRLPIKASDGRTDRQAVKWGEDRKELNSLLPDNATLIYASPIKASRWPSRAALQWDPLVCSAHHLEGAFQAMSRREAGRGEVRADNLCWWLRTTPSPCRRLWREICRRADIKMKKCGKKK